MFCNGNCGICPFRCNRGEVPPLSQKEIEGASKAFDSVVVSKNVEPLQIETLSSEETGLAVIENIGTYEVTRSIFGKEKVRKKK